MMEKMTNRWQVRESGYCNSLYYFMEEISSYFHFAWAYFTLLGIGIMFKIYLMDVQV